MDEADDMVGPGRAPGVPSRAEGGAPAGKVAEPRGGEVRSNPWRQGAELKEAIYSLALINQALLEELGIPSDNSLRKRCERIVRKYGPITED